MGRFDFLIPASGSLKDKRQVVKHIIASMRAKYNVAVAEVDHLELRQRCAIGVCCVSNSSFHARKMLQELRRFMFAQHAIEMLDEQSEVIRPDA